MSDREAFLKLGNRVRRAWNIEQRRTAREIVEAVKRRGADRDVYDATMHAMVMLDVDQELDRIYGRYAGDPSSVLLRFITRQARATWRERIDRVALVGGGYKDGRDLAESPGDGPASNPGLPGA